MIRVRPATALDVPAVLPMVRAICDLHEAWDAERYGMLADVVERYARWLPERAVDPRSVFLVAEGGSADGGGLAGFLVGTCEENIPIYRVKEFGFIHDVWVDERYRRQGVAAALTEAAVERFRAIGVVQVRLETARANESARALFESCGFRIGAIDMLKHAGPRG